MLHNYKLKEGLIHPFTPDEVDLIEQSQTANTANMNQQGILSEIYSAKIVEKSASTIIESNRQLVNKIISAADRINESSDRNALAMTRLTMALVFVGIIQVVVQIIDLITTSPTS